MEQHIAITDNYIALGTLLKLVLRCSGGGAKHMIQSGLVSVNGHIELRRGRKLVPGDCVQVVGREDRFVVVSAAGQR